MRVLTTVAPGRRRRKHMTTLLRHFQEARSGKIHLPTSTWSHLDNEHHGALMPACMHAMEVGRRAERALASAHLGAHEYGRGNLERLGDMSDEYDGPT